MLHFIRNTALIFSLNFLAVLPLLSQTCLLADFPFNGNANDITGNGNNGTVTGASPTTDRFGNPNKAYFFDAVDDGIVTNNTLGNFGTGNFTISCWIKSTMTSTARFISKRGACTSSVSFFNLTLSSGKIQFETKDVNGSYVYGYSTGLVNDGNWHHVAVVRSGTLYSIFIDGLLSFTLTTPSPNNSNNTSPLKFGIDVCVGVGNSVKFTGSLDDIKIYNCALSATEITQLFESFSTSTSSTPATCGVANGSATVSVSGGSGNYTYQWSPSAGTGATLSGVPFGTYSVTVTDVASSVTANASIQVPYLYTTTSTLTSNPVCLGAATQFTLTNNDLLTSWSYTFSDGTSSTAQNPSRTFVYCPPFDNWATVIVTNNFGCKDTLINHAVVHCPVYVNYEGLASTQCSGDCKGTSSIQITQGAPPFTIEWSDPQQQSTTTANNLCEGSYIVSVTDNNGCATSLPSINVTSPNEFSGTVSTYHIKCFGGATGTAVLYMNGGIPPYTYSWSSSLSSDNTLTDAPAGTYCVTVTDGPGCTFDTCITITQPSDISGNVQVTNTACGQCVGSVTVSVSGGNSPYSYLWSNGDTTSSVNSLCAGVYSLTLTDANGCSKQFIATVNTINGPVVTLDETEPLCFGDCTGSVTASVASCPTCTFSWQNSNGTSTIGNGSVITNLCAGEYISVVTDSPGCKTSTSFTIEQPAELKVTTSAVDVLVIGECTGSVSTTVGGGIAPYSYEWTDETNTAIPGATASSLSDLCAGTYNVRVTDDNNCQSQWVAALVDEPIGLTLTAASVTANIGAEVVIPITVQSFQNIAGMQGSITFDPQVITLLQTEQFGLPGMTTSNFGTLQAASGVITFLWDDATTLGVSLADGSILFALRFEVTGSAGQQSEIEFSSTPALLEFIDPLANVVDATFESGTVAINPALMVTGFIESEDGQPVRSATVNLSGAASQTTTTDLDGSYEFTIDQAGTYSITPSKTNDGTVANGITTSDIIFLRRHILGIQPLATPYKIIAADVNGNSNVTTADIALVRSLVLGNITTFPNGKLWAFVPASHTFANPQNPFPYPSNLTYNSITTPLSNQNFIGIKLGDLNDTWDHTIPKTGDIGTVRFGLEQRQALPGEQVIIPVRVKDFNSVSGYQFTVSWNPAVLMLDEAINKKLNGYFGLNSLADGYLTTSWSDDGGGGISLLDNEVVFELKFNVIGAEGTFTEIKIGSELATSEAYNENIDLLYIQPDNGMVAIGDKLSSSLNNVSSIANFSVNPNPFSGSTNIIFSVLKDEIINIEIYDLLGKQVKQIRANYIAGEHFVQWDGADNVGNKLSKGVYHIRVSAGKNSNYVKVILLE